MLSESESIDYSLAVHEFETQKAQQSFRSFVMSQVARLEQKGKLRTAETYLSTHRSFMRFLKRYDISLGKYNE